MSCLTSLCGYTRSPARLAGPAWETQVLCRAQPSCEVSGASVGVKGVPGAAAAPCVPPMPPHPPLHPPGSSRARGSAQADGQTVRKEVEKPSQFLVWGETRPGMPRFPFPPICNV